MIISTLFFLFPIVYCWQTLPPGCQYTDHITPVYLYFADPNVPGTTFSISTEWTMTYPGKLYSALYDRGFIKVPATNSTDAKALCDWVTISDVWVRGVHHGSVTAKNYTITQRHMALSTMQETIQDSPYYVVGNESMTQRNTLGEQRGLNTSTFRRAAQTAREVVHDTTPSVDLAVFISAIVIGAVAIISVITCAFLQVGWHKKKKAQAAAREANNRLAMNIWRFWAHPGCIFPESDSTSTLNVPPAYHELYHTGCNAWDAEVPQLPQAPHRPKRQRSVRHFFGFGGGREMHDEDVPTENAKPFVTVDLC